MLVDVIPNHLADDLRRGQIVKGANFFEYLLLGGVDQQSESGSAVFHLKISI